MKTRRGFIFLFLIISFLASCASTPDAPVPQWVIDSEVDFPQSEYIFQLGIGNTSLEAKTNSQAELAAYLNTSVKRVVEAEKIVVSNNDSVTQNSSSVNSNTVTTTDLNIYGMRTTEPYFFKGDKKWYCGAYIVRKDAFEQMAPAIRDDANKFYGVYELSEKTNDPLKKIKIYGETQKTAQLFVNDLYTSIMFSKKLTEKEFGNDRDFLASLDGKIQKAKNICVMYFNVPVDSSKMVSSAAKKAFSDNSFIISEDKPTANYIVDVDVKYNMETEGSGEEAMYVCYPSVAVKVTGPEGSVYVFERKIEKNISYIKSKAEAKACSNVAEVIKNELYADFAENMGLNN